MQVPELQLHEIHPPLLLLVTEISAASYCAAEYTKVRDRVVTGISPLAGAGKAAACKPFLIAKKCGAAPTLMNAKRYARDAVGEPFFAKQCGYWMAARNAAGCSCATARPASPCRLSAVMLSSAVAPCLSGRNVTTSSSASAPGAVEGASAPTKIEPSLTR